MNQYSTNVGRTSNGVVFLDLAIGEATSKIKRER
eukprot:SAG31_NODE_1386_length_8574_cov_2.055037_15_plen_33_part_01